MQSLRLTSSSSLLTDTVCILMDNITDYSRLSCLALITLVKVHEVLSHSYDYIIIGTGPSACGLLHGILSQEQHNISNNHQTPKRTTICILEAGGSKQQASTTHAKDWPQTALHTNHQHNNNYMSVPQTALNNRVLDIPIGNGLGGGSNINACLLSSPGKSAFVLFSYDFMCLY